MRSIFGTMSGPVDPSRTIRTLEPNTLSILAFMPRVDAVDERRARTIPVMHFLQPVLSIADRRSRRFPIVLRSPSVLPIAGLGVSPDGLGGFG